MKKYRKKRKAGRILSVLGAVFLFFAAALAGFNVREDYEAGKHSEKILMQVKEKISENSTAGRQVIPKEKREKKEKTFPDGILAILKIPEKKLELPVFNTYSEELMKESVCQYGENKCKEGQLIIAGHNYEKHFRRIRTMEPGDKLTLEFPEEIRAYTVSETAEIDGTDREGLFSGDWDLSLFTCSFNRERRMIVRCKEE